MSVGVILDMSIQINIQVTQYDQCQYSSIKYVKRSLAVVDMNYL